ncbi:hypothetical protein [Streptomyces sp. NPDC086787]|uniref:hypothetical protein n=1 Tax=Streptomyces sp. NPDC086787 TaxID=3365759 RepID=UPI00382F63CB
MRRRTGHTHALLPAFAVTALLFAAGCSTSAPQAEQPDAGQSRQAGSQDSGTTTEADRPLTVAAAPEAAATAATGPAGSGKPAHKTTLTVSSYDSRTRRAVISEKSRPGSPTARPSATASASPSSPASPSPSASATPREAAVGDVIASAPAPGAPHGLLAKVTKVIGETDKGTEVQTEPAALNSVLGDSTAKGTVPVDPSSFDIRKLLPDVKVSWSKTGDVHIGPKGATVPLGSLRLDVSAEVPTPEGAPVSAAAAVSGFVQVAPQVDFTYGGTGTAATPGSAYLGVSGDWTSGWSVKGHAAASLKPLRIPFAKLHADPVLQVGPVPVVINLDLTCYFQISADGKVTIDVEQNVKGDFKAGGTFGAGRGWTPVSSSDMTGTPVRTSLTAAGNVKAALGAEASVGLYGAVGVTADLAPYLRGEASGSVNASSNTPGAKTSLSWGLYGGVDLSGTLRFQLSIFGTPVFQRSVPLGTLHREWKLASGSL